MGCGASAERSTATVASLDNLAKVMPEPDMVCDNYKTRSGMRAARGKSSAALENATTGELDSVAEDEVVNELARPAFNSWNSATWRAHGDAPTSPTRNQHQAITFQETRPQSQRRGPSSQVRFVPDERSPCTEELPQGGQVQAHPDLSAVIEDPVLWLETDCRDNPATTVQS
ncbi:hypothetical protein AK812_SmicGene27059 [Symbiodinium microadriaticum]|uniref:Uncharacterized protein n=1 Tax=Symbiodinium microadriaticum TaxID=2951 RepID=A0A1Q9D7R4_SYMMI|nr:hypothetical protein AK812_SmicGene27059 [Symbiodinium microadriaticum]